MRLITRVVRISDVKKVVKRNVILLFTFQKRRRTRNEKYDKLRVKLRLDSLRTFSPVP